MVRKDNRKNDSRRNHNFNYNFLMMMIVLIVAAVGIVGIVVVIAGSSNHIPVDMAGQAAARAGQAGKLTGHGGINEEDYFKVTSTGQTGSSYKLVDYSGDEYDSLFGKKAYDPFNYGSIAYVRVLPTGNVTRTIEDVCVLDSDMKPVELVEHYIYNDKIYFVRGICLDGYTTQVVTGETGMLPCKCKMTR